MKQMLKTRRARLAGAMVVGSALLFGALLSTVNADETCQSPYMAKIVGQEDYVYTWTLGQEGLGDGQDKLVTVDVNPDSDTYGKIVHIVSVGGRNEAHHGGFTDDRKYLWLGGLDSNKIFIFDVHTHPGKPKLAKVITDFTSKTGGLVGPHTFYAMPGRMLITALSNNTDHGGRTGLAEYTNGGEYVKTYWNPTDENLRGANKAGKFADGYGYDLRAMPRDNVMLSSSFTGWNNYMQDLGKLLKDPESMKHFGNTMVLWNLHTREAKKVFSVPGAPLEVRAALGSNHDYFFTTTALTSKIWLIFKDKKDGQWKAEDVATIGNPKDIPLPVDISISSDDKRLWVQTFTDGKTRLFDITDPHDPEQIYSKKIGKQVNMISQSWDGKRLYFTSSLLSNWDKTGKKRDQYLSAYTWDADKMKMKKDFEINFIKKQLGLPHIMRFGDRALYTQNNQQQGTPEPTRLSEAEE